MMNVMIELSNWLCGFRDPSETPPTVILEFSTEKDARRSHAHMLDGLAGRWGVSITKPTNIVSLMGCEIKFRWRASFTRTEAGEV